MITPIKMATPKKGPTNVNETMITLWMIAMAASMSMTFGKNETDRFNWRGKFYGKFVGAERTES
jgi:hypothetical protein